MKLYFSPGACSLSPHIVAHEIGLPLELERVDGAAKKTAGGRDFWSINPKGYVPALELVNGEILTEGPTIVSFLADQRPDAKLLPPPGTIERYRVLETLGYINSELHKTYSPLFNPKIAPELRDERNAYLRKRYAVLENQLARGPYLFGAQFTVADAYLFTVTSWAALLNIDLAQFPNLVAFQARVLARPAVVAAMTAEGLNKA